MNDERYRELGAALVSEAGGYLRNVRTDASVCAVCRTPVGGYARCFPCQQRLGTIGLELADRTGFLTYAINGEQSGAALRRYKSTYPSAGARRALTLLAANGLLRHADCLRRAASAGVSHWTCVPSLSGRTEPHPLRPLVQRFAPGTQCPTTSVVQNNPRSTDPDHFVVPRLPAGSHLLVLDDTWASGGHAQSLAIAAQRAGAETVSILGLARWLNGDFGRTGQFIRDLPTTFDPAVCAWLPACTR